VVIDLDALDSDGESMITRANGLPIRLEAKSVRCRAITDRVLRHYALRPAQGAYSLTWRLSRPSVGTLQEGNGSRQETKEE
jgi:hypothetical protein